MKHTTPFRVCALLALTNLGLLPFGIAQNPPDRGPEGTPPFRAGPGGGGMMREKVELLSKFDKDGDGRLNAAERKPAREFVQKERAEGRNRRGFGPPGGPGFGRDESPKPVEA